MHEPVARPGELGVTSRSPRAIERIAFDFFTTVVKLKASHQPPIFLRTMEQPTNDKTPRCLCGVSTVTTGSVIIGVIEILVVSHSLIFAFANYFAGPEKYEQFNPVFAAVIKYEYLLPFLVIQIIWIVSNVILFVGIKGPFPFLALPHIIVQLVVITGGITLSIVAFVNIGRTEEVNWALGVSLSLCIIISLAEIYFFYVMIVCYKHLKQLKVAVAAERQWLNFATMPHETDIQMEEFVVHRPTSLSGEPKF